jgi:hypothetical protein
VIAFSGMGWVQVTAIAFAGLLAPLSHAAPASATVRESAFTHYVLSASRATDGTVTATARVTSGDDRCLALQRFAKLQLSDGYYHIFDTSELLYEGISKPWPSEKVGEPPVWFQAPSSRPERSPFVWHSVEPGAALAAVGQDTKAAHKEPVANATGIALYGPTTPADNNRPYKVKYRRSGEKVVLTCAPLKGTAKVIVQF